MCQKKLSNHYKQRFPLRKQIGICVPLAILQWEWDVSNIHPNKKNLQLTLSFRARVSSFGHSFTAEYPWKGKYTKRGKINKKIYRIKMECKYGRYELPVIFRDVYLI